VFVPVRFPSTSNAVIRVFLCPLRELFHVTDLSFNGANVLDSYEGIIKILARKLLQMKKPISNRLDVTLHGFSRSQMDKQVFTEKSLYVIS